MRAHPDNSKMKVKKMIAAMRLYAAAIGSVTPNCNCTTSNLMATIIFMVHDSPFGGPCQKLFLSSNSFVLSSRAGIDTQNYDFMLNQHWNFIYAHTKQPSFRAASCIVDCRLQHCLVSTR